MIVSNTYSQNPLYRFVIVVTIIAAFSTIRLFWLSNNLLGFDESYTQLFVQQNWLDLGEYVVENDMHPPLYFAFVKLFGFLGNSEFALRFPSWFLATLSMPVLYFAGRNLGGPKYGHKVGILVMVLTGLSLNHLSMSLNARAYAAMFFATSICCWAITWIAANPDTSGKFLASRKGRGGLVAYLGLAVGLAMLPWLHNIGVFYVFSIGVSLFVLWLVIFNRKMASLTNLALTALIAILLWSPNLTNFIGHSQSVADAFWVRSPTVSSVAKLILSVFGHAIFSVRENPADLTAALAICLVGTYFVAQLAIRREWVKFSILVLPILVLLSLLITVSLFVQPILLHRLVFPFLPFWFLLLALGAVTISQRSKIFASAITGFLVVWFAIGHFTTLLNNDKSDILHDVLETIAVNSTGTPLVITVPNSAALVLGYHRDGFGYDIDILPGEGAFPMKNSDLVYPTGWAGVPAITPSGITKMEQAIEAAPGDVWLMLRNYWIYDPDNLIKTHFDRKYCYQTLNISGNTYLFFLKLIPIAHADSIECSRYDSYRYPRERTDQVNIPLKSLRNGP